MPYPQGQVILMRIFKGIGYDVYMVSDRKNPETGSLDRTIEFVEVF